MKEYLLLRNNVQSGPYSLEELRQMGLRTFDLLWIEKKSFSWKYPSEMNELAAFAPAIEPVLDESLKVPAGASRQQELNRETVAVVSKAVATEEVGQRGEAPIRHMAHIVALKPKIDHIEIRTIKSVHQPNIVKVEVREKENSTEGSTNAERIPPTTAILNNNSMPAPEMTAVEAYTPAVISDVKYFNDSLPYGKSNSSNNRLEIVVLAIGAASLLGVIYLLLTNGYY